MKKEHTIDAENKSLGRVATEVALVLRGKDSPSFERHIAPDVSVTVINAGKLSLTEKKQNDKVYTHYTGYPGGLRKTTLSELLEKKGPEEVVRKAVYGMLPNNKLRSKMLKNLHVAA